MPVPQEQSVSARSLLRDTAFHLLRDAIVDGTLAPGERLRDTELERWLGVSRTPIREALARLEQAGLVRTKPGRSTTVSPLDVRHTREAQLVVAGMHELAVRECVPYLTDADLDRMRAANDRFAHAMAIRDVDAAVLADDEFHGVPVAVAANRALVTVLEQLTPVMRRVERLRFSTLSGRASVAQHARIIEFCAAGNADAAAVATRENWHTLQPLLTHDLDEEP